MREITEFLDRFLSEREGLTSPDGRLLWQYNCNDLEFKRLTKLLHASPIPIGHDFNIYRERWQQLKGADLRGWGLDFHTEQFPLHWQMCAFVLYASVFWNKFMNKSWIDRKSIYSMLPQKLTWLQFLSPIGWDGLYKAGKPYAYLQLHELGLDLALLPRQYDALVGAERNHDIAELRLVSTMPTVCRHAHLVESKPLPNYPALYLPMLVAWDWWQVAPMRLPTSIRYLDTIAHQGGALESLVVEFKLAGEDRHKIIYTPIKPKGGYGIDTITLDKNVVNMINNDPKKLNVSVVFGSSIQAGSDTCLT